MAKKKDWEESEILDLLNKGTAFKEIQKIYPRISSLTLTRINKKRKDELELEKIKLKLDYAKKVAPEISQEVVIDSLSVDAFLRNKWEEFVFKAFPMLEKIDKIIEARLDETNLKKKEFVSTKDLITYKFNLLNLLSKGGK